jgi:hypothetical protein
MRAPPITPSEEVAAPAGLGWRRMLWATPVLVVLLYVLSAPLLRDGQGFPLPICRPVWSAAASGPVSPILKPYFKFCGVDFQPSAQEPPRESYE